MKGVHALSGAVKNATPKPIITSASTRLTMCWPLNTTGALENSRKCLPRPASLPNAMTEPEKVSAPTKVPMKSSSRLPAGSCAGMPKAVGLLTTETAISTAAMPTSECIAATSSGICVICTRRATNAPIEPPISITTHDEADAVPRHAGNRERRQHRDRHAGHAEKIAAARRLGMRKPFQRQNEAHRRERGTTARRGSPSSRRLATNWRTSLSRFPSLLSAASCGTSRACAASRESRRPR